MEWRWNNTIKNMAERNKRLNPCSNGMALEHFIIIIIMKKMLS